MREYLKFTSKTCGPCKMLNHVLPSVLEELGIEIKEVDTDEEENKELLEKFDVMKNPQIIIVEDGKEVDRIIGFQPPEVLKDFLKQ